MFPPYGIARCCDDCIYTWCDAKEKQCTRIVYTEQSYKRRMGANSSPKKKAKYRHCVQCDNQVTITSV